MIRAIDLWLIGLEHLNQGSFLFNITIASSSLTNIMVDVIRWTTLQAELNELSQKFGGNCQFQNVLGVLDSSHVPTNAPKHQQQAYINKKKFYLDVLLACCNVYMEFLRYSKFNQKSCEKICCLQCLRNTRHFSGGGVIIVFCQGDEAYFW